MKTKFTVFMAVFNAILLFTSNSFADDYDIKAATQRIQTLGARIIGANLNQCPIETAINCGIKYHLLLDNKINAATFDKDIYVNEGMEKLLNNDNELAFIIAHETAHALLHHSAKGREQDIKNQKIRAQMEIDADNLGVLLMARAGFEPKSAISAHAKIYQYGRGPINRTLGIFGIELNGAYLSTEKRIELLKARAQEVKNTQLK